VTIPPPPSDATYQEIVTEYNGLLARLRQSNERQTAYRRDMRRQHSDAPSPPAPVDIAHPMPAQFACPKCQDIGVVKVASEAGRYGLEGWRYDLVPCQCRAQQVRERQATRVKAASNLTPEMQDMTFDTYDRAWDQDAYDTALAFAEALATGAKGIAPFLVLSGTYGSGKTHLQAAIAHHAMQHGRQPLFAVVPSLLDWFKSAFGQPTRDRAQQDAFEARFAGICDADVLLLDDLGAEYSTKWAQEKLYQIINHRYARRLPTVFSTNLLPEQLEPRIADRLTDAAYSEQVYTVDKSYRRRQARPKQQTKKRA